jgi:internalin A
LPEFPDLIPQLLSAEEPGEAEEFRPEECLNFQFHYSVLPEGLLPRFIVRSHILSKEQPRWRRGVILKLEDNRALVKAEMIERKVYILISGPLAGRRRLLATIRAEFERIHRSIPNLNVREVIPLPAAPDVLIPYQELIVMERSGISRFPKVVGSVVMELNIQELLNGGIKGTHREQSRKSSKQVNTVRLFYCYADEDNYLGNELGRVLNPLLREGWIESWQGLQIPAGEKWQNRIDKNIYENMEQVEIILLLLSDDFIASNFLQSVEMRRVLERHKKGEARVILILLRDVNWYNALFAKPLQVLPINGIPITRWPDRDSAWQNVAEGIKKAVKEIRKRSARKIYPEA